MDLSLTSPPAPLTPHPVLPPHRRTRQQKIGIAFACLLPFFALFLVVRVWEGGKMPVVHIPPQQFPQPNAFDTFVQAGKMADKDKDLVGDALSSTPKQTWTTAQKEALLAANAPALSLVRGAFNVPYQDKIGPRSYNTTFPHYAQFRNLCRFFVLEGDIKRERGDSTGAAQSDGDAVVFGQKIARGTPLIGNLVSAACQAIGRKHLWQGVNAWDANTARKTAHRLEKANQAYAQNAPFADTITEEKWWGQSTLMDVFQNPKQNPIVPNLDLSLLIWSKRTMMNNYSTFMDTFAVYAREPYQKHPKGPQVPNDPLDLILLPVFAQARYKSVANDTQNSLLVAALAVRAYEADHNGAAPPDLQSLVPAYLVRVPADPFAFPVAPLKYQFSGGGGKPVVYSVGPDNQDNRGTPALSDDRSKPITSSSKYYSSPTCKGDLVAGVNLN